MRFKLGRVALFVSLSFCLPASSAEQQVLNADLLDLKAKLFTSAFKSFVNDLTEVQPDLHLGSVAIAPPKFDASLQRNDWISFFNEWLIKQKSVPDGEAATLRLIVPNMFTSYFHDEGFSRVAYLEPYTDAIGSSAVSRVENLRLGESYPRNHTLDIPGYVNERFPRDLQDFASAKNIPLVIDDSNCADAYAYQLSQGYSVGTRFMGARDSSDSQFLFVYNPKSQSYRFVVCDIDGKDDETRIVAILGPSFFHQGATRVYHARRAPLLEFNDEGLDLKIDSEKDLVVIGFQNTVWWQLANSSVNWQRRSITDSGPEVSIFENKVSGVRVVSLANVYGDEMLEALQTLFDKGARRWLYLGTAGALDPTLQIGDVLLPKRFLKPDGRWFEFTNDGENVPLKLSTPVKKVSSTAQGWVGTLIQETRDHLAELKDLGVQAVDVESRYFAEFMTKHPATEKQAVIVISDQPLGSVNYNNENATRALPMKSITELLPQLALGR